MKKLHISKTRWNKTAENRKREMNGHRYIWIEIESRWQEIEDEYKRIEKSPVYGALTVEKPWNGLCKKAPWEYEVTAVIPCLNTIETLSICIELLRLQTIRPYIMLVDTGSNEFNLQETIDLQDEDVEIHVLNLNGVRHPSDYPAMAMDCAMSLCRTPYLFATHADCFLRRRDLIEDFLNLCKTKSPCVGYELSPRAHKDWKGMLSHTASMYDMKVMDRIGFGWSLRRLCNRYNIVDYLPDPTKPNWPDTEILGNYIMQDNNITPYIVAGESNHARTLDENIDHFRSYIAGKMYSPPYFVKVKEWFEEAKKEALMRIEEWSLND